MYVHVYIHNSTEPSLVSATFCHMHDVNNLNHIGDGQLKPANCAPRLHIAFKHEHTTQ